MEGICLLLKCGACGHVVERVVKIAALVGAATFAPLRCVECLAQACEPTVRPYELSHGDRKFLRAMRIEATT